MELNAQEFNDELGNVIRLSKIEQAFVTFQYRIGGKVICSGTKKEIAKEIDTTPENLTKRIYNYRRGRSKVKHELIICNDCNLMIDIMKEIIKNNEVINNG